MSITAETREVTSEILDAYIPVDRKSTELVLHGNAQEHSYDNEREYIIKFLLGLRDEIKDLKESVSRQEERLKDMDFNGCTSVVPEHAVQDVRKTNVSYPSFDNSAEYVEDTQEATSIADYEKSAIVKALQRHGGKRNEAAADLKISLRTLYRKLKEYDIDLYRIARKGQFGINGTKVLPQFEVLPHEKVIEMMNDINVPLNFVGMDFGFETSYNAVVRMTVDVENRWLYIHWEYYKNKQTDDETVKDLIEFTKTRERIIADSAEPKTIKYFKKMGFNMKAAKKFQGSRLSNTKKIKRFKRIICSADCKNVVRELKTLTYAVDKKGKVIYDEFNIDPHTFSAIWYGLDKYDVTDLKSNFLR